MEGTSDVSDAGDNVCFDQDSIVILSDDEDEENNVKNGGLDDESIQILSRRVRPSDSGTGPVVISDITRARGNSEGAQSLISSLTSGSALTETTQSRDRAGSEAVSGISSLTESQGGRSTPASAINSGQESELESDVEVGPGSPRNSDPQMAPFVNELPAPKPTVDDSSNNISYGGISKRPFLINAFSTFFKGSNSSIIDDDLDVDTNLTIGSLVKVKGCNKSNSSLEFTGLRITQTIRVHDGPIWTMKFSPDGSYLASGGQDGRIIIWSVGNAHTDTNENSSSQHKRAASSGSASASQPDLCPHKDKSEFAFRLLHRTPYRIFQGHASDVIDLAWSRSNFLLSASVDKTVRLWHISRDDCLQTFKHADIVTGVAFHPTHDRYFVSSCFDRRVRIWDIIPDGAVKEWCLVSQKNILCFQYSTLSVYRYVRLFT